MCDAWQMSASAGVPAVERHSLMQRGTSHGTDMIYQARELKRGAAAPCIVTALRPAHLHAAAICCQVYVRRFMQQTSHRHDSISPVLTGMQHVGMPPEGQVL